MYSREAESVQNGYISRAGFGAVNDSFSDDTGHSGAMNTNFGGNNLISMTPPTYHRDLTLFTDQGSNVPGYRTRSVVGPDQVYDQRSQSGYYSQSYGSSSPFFHGTLPKHLRDQRSSDWVAAPLRLPDWSATGPSWSHQDPSYPPDYGLPVQRGSLR